MARRPTRAWVLKGNESVTPYCSLHSHRCPVQHCPCQGRQDQWAHCRWHEASQPHLAFSRAALPEESPAVSTHQRPLLTDMTLQMDLLCKNVHHCMQDYINLLCLSIPGASMVQAFLTMFLDIVKNY